MPDSEKTFGFIPDFQKMFVVMMLFDKESSPLIPMIEPESFDSPVLKDLVAVIVDFYKEYGRAPAVVPKSTEFWGVFDTFLGEKRIVAEKADKYCDTAIEILEIGKEGEIDFRYYRDKLVEFLQYQKVKKAVGGETLKGHMERRDYGKIVAEIQKAMLVGKNLGDLGIIVNQDWEKRLEDRHTKFNRKLRAIPTGFSAIDNWLGGGICPQEMGIIMGYTGTGKTTFIVNIVKGALDRSHDVVHYSFEANELITEEIYDASITGVDKKNLDKERSTVKQLKEDFLNRPGLGRLVIKGFETKGTPQMIESHLHYLKSEKNINPSLIIVDYLGLMKSSDKSVKHESRYTLFGEIMLELKNIAQRGDYAFWILFQSVKGSRYKERVTMEDAADSQEVMRHADLVLTISQTRKEEEMKPHEVIRIFAAKGRNVPDGWEETFQIDRTKALIWGFGTREK